MAEDGEEIICQLAGNMEAIFLEMTLNQYMEAAVVALPLMVVMLQMEVEDRAEGLEDQSMMGLGTIRTLVTQSLTMPPLLEEAVRL